jgi:flagellar hook-associated protein 3 FlgL
MINGVGNRLTREMTRHKNLAAEIEKTQIQISSGKRLINMSDDPVAARRISTIQTSQKSMDAWALNLNTARGMVDQGETILKSATKLLTRANELALTSVNGTMDPIARRAVALELRSIADELDNLATTRGSNGEPIFSNASKEIRFDADVKYAPLPTAETVFSIAGTSISSMLRDAAQAAEDGDDAAMTAALTRTSGAIDHLTEQHAMIGLSSARLERIADSLELRTISNADERSTLEDTDLTEAISRLNAQDITLSAAQAAFAKINRQTLFDILG